MVGLPCTKVIETTTIESLYRGPYTYCTPAVHPDFDRHEASLFGADENAEVDYSAHRRVAFRLPDGRAVLQHTRNSYADFFQALRSPGQLPP